MSAEADPLAVTWERIYRIEENVRRRRERAVAALKATGIPYAIIGGNAVAYWVASVDEGLVRNTKDVDVLVRREDLHALIPAMEAQGWIHVHTSGFDFFLDGKNGKSSEGIHLFFAGEKVKPTDVAAVPTIDDAQETDDFRVISLAGVVTMKLIAFRTRDRMHLRDLQGAGLIDATWPSKFPPPLSERLQAVLDDPDG